MNFSDIVESLGLEKLASSPASDGPRGPPEPGSPSQGRPRPDDAPGEEGTGPMSDVGGPAGPGGEPDSSDDRTFEWSQDDDDDGASDGDGAEPAPATESLESIQHDIDQLAADIEDNSSEIRGIRSQYDELIDRLDQIEEHNTRLLGVYDRLTAGINPFAEDWEARYDRSRENPEADDRRYNVIEPPEDAEPDPVGEEPMGEEPPGEPEADAGDPDEEPVSFEDLRERQASEPWEEEFEPTDLQGPGDGSGGSGPGRGDGDGRSPRPVDGDAFLSALEPGYATDVLMMEWLSMLIDIAGSSGALKALDYYENIDWISRPVKHQLEDLLAGARVPSETPARPPGDLSTEEHNRSFAYIVKLAQQQQTVPRPHPD